MVEIVDRLSVRWLPTAVARRVLGVSRQRVYQLVKSGRLAACRIDGVLMISSVSVDNRCAALRREDWEDEE